VQSSNLKRFERALRDAYGIEFPDYWSLHEWSTSHPEEFWRSVWDFSNVCYSVAPSSVLQGGENFSSARWFEGARLNFAENLLRRSDEQPAIVSRLENGERRVLSWRELEEEVARVAAALRANGVGAGDRVAGLLPNVAETVVAMLGTASIGAIWSSCSPDFGANSVLDRFGQITPKVLFACDGYYYNGKTFDCREKVRTLAEALGGDLKLVIVPVLGSDVQADKNVVAWRNYLGSEAPPALEFAQMPFEHPLYIMYSSGTTGVPKCIVHGAGGTLLQHLKEQQLHTGLKVDDVLFYFTTCGWMMWNWLVSGLATGATLLLYDGSPFYPRAETLWDICDEEGVDIMGVGAKYISAVENANVKPRQSHRLSELRTLLSTGSPLSHESFRFVYEHVKADLCLASISGGTDIISCFVLGNESLPVYEGELQCPGLGLAVEVWNENGEPIVGSKGDLVCTRPFPCTPLGFWNDPDGSRYRAAYFEHFPGIWAQGDYAEVTANGGLIIHGRSDAVLNPGGVRIGTAEIYRQAESLEEVVESICVGQEWNNDVRVVLFVVLAEGIELSESLSDRIRQQIRRETTPRHVPAKVIQVTDIPRTRSGKIAEIAVRNTINGMPVGNRDALSNPEALAQYLGLSELGS
jgi:acetoacetyl-CoA synthetase